MYILQNKRVNSSPIKLYCFYKFALTYTPKDTLKTQKFSLQKKTALDNTLSFICNAKCNLPFTWGQNSNWNFSYQLIKTSEYLTISLKVYDEHVIKLIKTVDFYCQLVCSCSSYNTQRMDTNCEYMDPLYIANYSKCHLFIFHYSASCSWQQFQILQNLRLQQPCCWRIKSSV